jgi:hypothetical protein
MTGNVLPGTESAIAPPPSKEAARRISRANQHARKASWLPRNRPPNQGARGTRTAVMNAPARVRAPHSPPATRVDPVKVLIARAEARAQLWFDGELDLHTAVDELWAAAVRDGLVDRLGADEIQRLLTDAFAPLRTGDDVFATVAKTPDDEEDPLLEGLKICADTKRHLEEWENAKTAAAGLPDPLPDDEDTFARACRTADEKARSQPVDPTIERARRLLADDVSFERAYYETRKPTQVPIATLRAAEYLHDLGDLERFKQWFDRHSADARAAISRHLNERAKKKRRGP